jgi:hypothetical protein
MNYELKIIMIMLYNSKLSLIQIAHSLCYIESMRLYCVSKICIEINSEIRE